jgi:hypothetical protein
MPEMDSHIEPAQALVSAEPAKFRPFVFVQRRGCRMGGIPCPTETDLHQVAQVDDESIADGRHGDPPAPVLGLETGRSGAGGRSAAAGPASGLGPGTVGTGSR